MPWFLHPARDGFKQDAKMFTKIIVEFIRKGI
jgi:hypothetical protein